MFVLNQARYNLNSNIIDSLPYCNVADYLICISILVNGKSDAKKEEERSDLNESITPN